jgi:hypothetical protein
VKPSLPRPVRAVAVAAIAAASLTACISQPSAKRVSEDLIRTLASTPEEEQCMLDKLDDYSQDELAQIGKNYNEGDLQEQAKAGAALEEFEADLASCRE